MFSCCRLHRFLVCLSISLLLLSVACVPVDPINYWVATDGDDSASGSFSSPFRTISHARDVVRAHPERGGRTIQVNIREGVYQLNATLTFDAGDSGGSMGEVVYQAAAGETVVISGAKKVTGWAPHDPALNIWSASVDTNGTMPRQLYVNGQRATRARTVDYPNYYTPTATGYTYNYVWGTDPQIPPTWARHDLVEAVTVTQWKMMRCPVESVAGNDVTMESVCWDNANVFPYPWNFHLLSWWENAYEFLDQPGEWYLDPTAKVLYYIPLASDDMTSADLDVQLPVLEKLVDVQGGVLSPVKHLRFRGLQFSYATWLEPNGSDGYALDQSGFILRGTNHQSNVIGHDSNATGIPGNVHLLHAQNVAFEGNVFTHLGGIGLNFGTGSQNNRIIDNTFTDISAAAIQLGGIAAEDHHPVYSSQLTVDNHIANNLIEYPGQEFYDAPGIYIGFTTRSIVEHNDINHTPWAGIAIGWGWGMLDPGGFAGLPNAVPNQWGVIDSPSAAQGNQIIYNKIENFLEKLWDGGAVYSTGFQGTSLENGQLIAWNVARNKRTKAGGNTFYTDGGSRYVTVRENVSLDNPQGYMDFGPCWKDSSFSAGGFCLLTDVFHYGTDMGGCIPYGDLVFENNYLRDPVNFYNICSNNNFPNAPTNMNFNGNVQVTSSAEVPAWILEFAGRQ